MKLRKNNQFSSLVLVILSVSFAGLLTGASKNDKLFEVSSDQIKEGEKLFQKGNTQGATACVSCHGAEAQGQAASGFPRLAGQGRFYILSSLQAYQSGLRTNPVMMTVAKALKESDTKNLAAYLEQLPLPAPEKGEALEPKLYRRGKLLADVGDSHLGIQGCNNCHGAGGTGEPPTIPGLAGQNSIYLQAQLHAWKSGERKTSADRMAQIAGQLNDEDMKTVANYYAQGLSSELSSQAPEIETSPLLPKSKTKAKPVQKSSKSPKKGDKS